MEQGITETRAELVTRRRRRSALLSAVAALLTAVFFFPKGVTEGLPFARLWLEMSIPTVALSVAAAIQYRWKEHSGAGAAAAALYWVFVLLGQLSYGTGFVIQAVLQTWAWYISRPGRQP